ncbi:hypothetical protein Mapa_013613 [Marchantia paleacea]|nr:hypothetical protein Mapa_013613 [Marchantia paleacea]
MHRLGPTESPQGIKKASKKAASHSTSSSSSSSPDSMGFHTHDRALARVPPLLIKIGQIKKRRSTPPALWQWPSMPDDGYALFPLWDFSASCTATMGTTRRTDALCSTPMTNLVGSPHVS